MLAGGLVLTTLLLMRQESWTVTLLDGLFWGAVAAFVIVRQVALTRAAEERTSRARLQHALVALGAATAMWVVAQAIGSGAS
jgi:hypothetical protein